ncbi:MAG: murein hydrolase activator EnvC family protein [Solirubrobacteraceae bacterium]
MRLRLPIAAVTLVLGLWAMLPTPGGAASLSSRIQSKQSALDGTRSKARVLVSDIRGYSTRIGGLQSDITGLQTRESRIQADLDRKLARLGAIQTDLRSERARLARLRARLDQARIQLSGRLVDLYKADNPDILTVVLSSNGFADLLENSAFARRVGRQDNRIITFVRRAKADATATEARLSGLEGDAKKVAAVVQSHRDEVAAIKGTLQGRRDAYATARTQKRKALDSVRGQRENLEGDLKDLQAQEAKISARLAGVGPGSIGPVRTGSGGLIWPVDGPILSPFGMRWGRLHAGVDIAVPSGTPVRAAAAGSVAIAGWVSGYGNYICVQHGGSLSTCYGHNTSLGVRVGQRVSQGQVIASSGCTGHCLGPHVHFETRIGGTPVDPLGYL